MADFRIDTQGMGKAMSNLANEISRERTAHQVNGYIQNFGFDADPKKIQAYVKANNGDLNTMMGIVNSIKQYNAAISEGAYTLSPGMGRFRAGGAPEAFIDPKASPSYLTQQLRGSQFKPSKYVITGKDGVQREVEPKTEADLLRMYQQAQAAGETVEYGGVRKAPAKTFDQELQLRKAGKPETTVTVKNLPPNERVDFEAMKSLMGYKAKDFQESWKEAKGTRDSLFQLEGSRDALERAGNIPGFGAKWVIAFNKAVGRLGLLPEKYQKMTDGAEQFMKSMGNQTAEIIKKFGSGTGLSDADREYAEGIAGGTITLNKDAIRWLMDAAEKAYLRKIMATNEEAQEWMQRASDGKYNVGDLRTRLPKRFQQKLELINAAPFSVTPRHRWQLEKAGSKFLPSDMGDQIRKKALETGKSPQVIWNEYLNALEKQGIKIQGTTHRIR